MALAWGLWNCIMIDLDRIIIIFYNVVVLLDWYLNIIISVPEGHLQRLAFLILNKYRIIIVRLLTVILLLTFAVRALKTGRVDMSSHLPFDNLASILRGHQRRWRCPKPITIITSDLVVRGALLPGGHQILLLFGLHSRFEFLVTWGCITFIGSEVLAEWVLGLIAEDASDKNGGVIALLLNHFYLKLLYELLIQIFINKP